MKNALNSVKVASPSTAAFDLSHDVKLSCNMGDLVPVLAMECIPGDRVKIGAESLHRLAPMLAPMMHRTDVYVEYFFVPNRLLWDGWETWISNGGSEPDPVNPLPAHPYLEYGKTGFSGVPYNKLMDYMGLPDPDQTPFLQERERVSALPFAAYQLIYNEYYRDENLIDSVVAPHGTPLLASGNNSLTTQLFQLRKRCWEADYFTKALPFAQKGTPVDIPLGTMPDIPVLYNRNIAPDTMIMNMVNTWTAEPSSSTPLAAGEVRIPADLSGDPGMTDLYAAAQGMSITATTINDLRTAYRLQEWLEKNARGGTRYSELIRAHFNVSPQDARLQRPEYIVGTKNTIQISEVLNTTGTVDAPQGNMAGHGISYDSGNIGRYFVQEHGYIIGIMSIMPKTAYQQGIPRHFLKYNDPTELAWPTFANLGEQSIQNREVMAFTDVGEDTWGYTPRYMEYKNLPSRVAGDFRNTLDFWHMGRIFDPGSGLPLLNESFVTADPTLRVFAVESPDEDHVWSQVMHHITCVRALPFFGTPTF